MKTGINCMFVVVLLWPLCGPGWCEDKKQPKKEDDPQLVKAWKDLEGRWKRVGYRAYGEYTEDTEGPEFVWAVSRQGVAVYSDGKLVGTPNASNAAKWVIDPMKKPAHLDIIFPVADPKPEIVKAIYQVDGDTLKIIIYSSSYRHQDRPPSFDVKADDEKDPIIYVYKRVK